MRFRVKSGLALFPAPERRGEHQAGFWQWLWYQRFAEANGEIT